MINTNKYYAVFIIGSDFYINKTEYKTRLAVKHNNSLSGSVLYLKGDEILLNIGEGKRYYMVEEITEQITEQAKASSDNLYESSEWEKLCQDKMNIDGLEEND